MIKTIKFNRNADMSDSEIPVWKSRDEIPEKYKWRLEDIFSDDKAWELSFKNMQSSAEKIVEWKGRVGSSSANLLSALECDSELDQAMSELVAYARMKRDENNSLPVYQDMTDRIMSLYFQIAAMTSFLRPEIAAIPEEKIIEYIEQEKGLQTYRHLLMNQIRQRPHILSESEEKLLSAFGNVSQGLEDVHNMLDNVDIKFGKIKDENDQDIELTMAKFAQLRDHPDRRVRADAFRKVHESYSALGNTLASLYSTQVKSDYVYASARKFSSSLAAALFSDRLPEELYTNLIDIIHDTQPVLNKYLDLRRRLLKLDELHIYDTYIPIIEMPKRRYSFEQACDMVKAALAPLGKEYAKQLERHLTDRWIDVYETPSKTSGAYSWGTYKTHPYVLLNFSGTLSDVFTLAHEIGHSMHTFFSSARPFVQSHYPIFLAEIASTVNENLLIRYLLEQCDETTKEGRLEKAWLLNHYLEEFRLTVFRQTMFAEFEKTAHSMLQSGETLNADSLNKLYAELLRSYFGPETVIDDYMSWEWSRIPHFYNSFYVFKYATGFSSAVAITKNIIENNAVDQYMQFLSAGGSDYPLNILAKAGVDLTGTEPLINAMKDFEKTLDMLSELI